MAAQWHSWSMAHADRDRPPVYAPLRHHCDTSCRSGGTHACAEAGIRYFNPSKHRP
jgi:hypothetical protein